MINSEDIRMIWKIKQLSDQGKNQGGSIFRVSFW